MFFENIQPLLAKGIKFTITVEADDTHASNVLVAIFPDAGEKNTSLTPAMFSASAKELDDQFTELMGTFVTVTKSLKEQLDDARLVAEQAGKEALANATKVQKPRNPKPANVAGQVAVADDDQDDDSGELTSSASAIQTTPIAAPQTPTGEAGPAPSFML